MKDVEKIVQQSFENFEPEVNSSVWQNLEHQLNAPVTSPVNSNPSAAIKVIAGKGTWLWIAGAVTTAVVATVLIVSKPQQKIQTSPEQQENVISQQVTEQKADNTEKNTPAPAEKIVEKNQEKIQQEHSVASIPPVIQPAAAIEKIQTQDAQQNEMQQSIPTEQAPAPQPTVVKPTTTSSNSNEKSPEPPAVTIITNTTCGFAPLKIIALINNDETNGTWDFGDGVASGSANKGVHVYTRPGEYTLTCRTGDKTISKTIEVVGIAATVFTPNGDGINDEFFFDAPTITELNAKIFDRSGHPVHEMLQPASHWDGTDDKGNLLPTGTYFYDIFARSYSGQTINQKGTINIFR